MPQSACQGDSYGSKVTSPSSLMCLELWDLTGGSKVEHNLCCVLHIWHQNLWNEEAFFFFKTLRCHLITLSFYFVDPAVARRSLLSAVIAASRFFPSSSNEADRKSQSETCIKTRYLQNKVDSNWKTFSNSFLLMLDLKCLWKNALRENHH